MIVILISVPIDCEWGAWTAWLGCSKTCNGGTQLRTRTPSQQALNGGKVCTGSSMEEQECNLNPCMGKYCANWSFFSNLRIMTKLVVGVALQF